MHDGGVNSALDHMQEQGERIECLRLQQLLHELRLQHTAGDVLKDLRAVAARTKENSCLSREVPRYTGARQQLYLSEEQGHLSGVLGRDLLRSKTLLEGVHHFRAYVQHRERQRVLARH